MSLAVIGLAHKLKYVAEKENVQQDDLCQPGHDPYEKTASHAGFTPSWCYTFRRAQSSTKEFKSNVAHASGFTLCPRLTAESCHR